MTLDKLKEIFKFSWAQAFSDQNGKSTIFPICCSVVIVTGCISLLWSMYLKDQNLAMWAATTITAGLAALTGRKIVNGKPNDLDIDPSDN